MVTLFDNITKFSESLDDFIINCLTIIRLLNDRHGNRINNIKIVDAIIPNFNKMMGETVCGIA